MFRDADGNRTPTTQRAVNLSLEFVTVSKLHRLHALESAFRGCVNRFIGFFWDNPATKDCAATREAVSAGRLPKELRNKARQLAFTTVDATRKVVKETGSKSSRPHYTGGLKLREYANVSVRQDLPHDGSALDVVVSLPSLVVGDRLVLVTKATAVLNKWLAQPGARFCRCIEVHGDRMTVVVEFLAPDLKVDGEVLGIDAGMYKLLSTSRGEFLGTDFKEIMTKVRRRKPGSKSKQRARRERDQAVNEALNKLPWDEIKAVAFEDLKGIKYGKKRSSKSFRRTMNSWVARQVAVRLRHKSAERGVEAVCVNPSWSSQNCSTCGKRGVRRGAVFYCESCNVVTDADYNAAVNIKQRGEIALAKNQITKFVQDAGILLSKTSNAPASGPKGSRKAREQRRASGSPDCESSPAKARTASGAGCVSRASHAGSRSDGRRTTPVTTRRERGGQSADADVKDPERVRTSGSPRRVDSLGRPAPKRSRQ